MSRFPFSSLRFRSMLLVLLVVLPAFGLILYIGLADWRTEVTEAQDNALRLARLAAFEEEQMIGATRQLLVTMAELPQVRSDDSATCNALMADIRKQFHRYANLGVIASNGDVICNALPISGQVNLADRDYFQRALLSRNFAIGDYQVGRVTGVPSINFGYPALDETGQITAVVFAALDLDWLNRLEYEGTAQLPQGATLTIIDSDGIVLVRHPDPERWVGQPLPETLLTRTVLTQDHGVITASGADGVARVYAFSPLETAVYGDNIRFILGIPEDVLFGEANRRLALSLTGLGIVALLALAAAWIGGDVFILRQVQALVKATGRLGAGDLNVRTGLPYDRGELGQLARAFDDMAESLEQRVAERQRAEEALRDKVAALQTLAEIDREIIAATEPHVILDLVCRRAAELMHVPKSALALEVSPGEMQMAASHGLYDPVRAGAEFARFWQAGAMRRGNLGTRGAFALDDIPADYPYMLKTLARENIRTYALASFVAREHVLGALLVFDTAPRAWSADEIQVLSLLAGQAAIGIENAELYSSLQEINDQLRLALRAKDEMIQNVSHELRTPLGILCGYVELLQDAGLGSLTVEQEQAVEIMHQQGDQLRFMVDRLLALQAFNANALQRIELDMGAWLPRILQPWEARAASRGVAGGIQLRLEIPDSLPTLSADSHFLEQVIENLLGNAIKFSPRGGEVRVRAWAEDGEVIIAVSDAGIGIPPDKLQQVFERFYQVDGSTTRRFGGMGIGLALCRAIVEAHGGRIWAESNGDGRGSTFYVALPAPTSSDTNRQDS